jgi:hypothetical protein
LLFFLLTDSPTGSGTQIDPEIDRVMVDLGEEA